METLVINVDNAEDANELVEKLNQLAYVKGIIWPNKNSEFNHVLPGDPLSDAEIDRLMDETESDPTLMSLDEVKDRLHKKFENAWKLNSDKGHI